MTHSISRKELRLLRQNSKKPYSRLSQKRGKTLRDERERLLSKREKKVPHLQVLLFRRTLFNFIKKTVYLFFVSFSILNTLLALIPWLYGIHNCF